MTGNLVGEVVLITGMGGELGTRVAQLVEEDTRVERIVGVDFVPPRRRLTRSEFVRIDPRRREHLAEFVARIEPTAVLHLGVYEPAARMGLASAAERTELSTIAALAAAARSGRLLRTVVRSGLEVYGPAPRRGPRVPDETVPPAPSTPFGHSQLAVETIAAGLGRRHGFPVMSLRLAPVVGSHVPSPLGRMLRLPAVPVPALADPPFSLLHPADAARAFAAALHLDQEGSINVVGDGAATPWQAVRLGGRVPIPVAGPFWRAAGRVVEVSGAAIAPHVIELLRHGRTADGSRASSVLRVPAATPTQQVLTDLYEWARVVPMEEARGEAA